MESVKIIIIIISLLIIYTFNRFYILDSRKYRSQMVFVVSSLA